MTLEEKSLFLAHHGVTTEHLYSWMDIYNLESVNDAILHYFSHHFCECCNKKKV